MVPGNQHPILTPALFGEDPLQGAVFMDCEASGLRSHSVPVEIAVAFADGRTEAMLVRPTADWLEHAQWDPTAEKIHKIPREEIMAAPTVEQVIVWLDRVIQPGMHVLSDNPSYEAMWCQRLYKAAGRDLPFQVLDWSSLMNGLFQAAQATQAQASAIMERVAADYPAPHRAAPDALRMAMMARGASGATMKQSRIPSA